MKAIVHREYGAPDVLRLEEIDPPVVEDDAVLVRVHASCGNAADWHLIRGEPYIARLSFGLRKPRYVVPGCDAAGRVEAVGGNATTVRPGDEVFGSVFEHGLGAFAELCVFPSEDLLAPKPANLTFEQAAAVPLAGLTALQALRDHGRIEAGHRVLIIGASGGVGTFAVQIAKSFRAEVTGVCSTGNVDLVRSIGADHVIDYTRDDYIQPGALYDLVVQLGGTRSPAECRRALTPNGTLVTISGDSKGRWIGPIGRIVKASALSPFVSQGIVSFTVKPNAPDLHTLRELIESGNVTPVIDRNYPLSDVPEAVRHLEAGNARGKVVITI
jgi:NADPH:quinone reductase-like Zn-dependent oxidoreductase